MRDRRLSMLWTTLAVLCIGLSAHAQGVWRLAGTMNGWNTADDAWTMRPVDGKPGVHRLRRDVPEGVHRFKFVRDGDWANGHFGGAGDSTLEMPGRDLILQVRARGEYEIELDTNSETWTSRTLSVLDPRIESVVRGTPTAGEPFLLDLSRTLLSDPEGAAIPTARVIVGEAEFLQVPTGRLSMLVTSKRAGPLAIELELEDGAKTLRERVDVEVQHRWSVHTRFIGEGVAFDREEPLRGMEPGVLRCLVWLKRDGVVEQLRVKRDGEVVSELEAPVEIEAGKFAVEVRDGALVKRPDALGGVLVRGDWTEFTYTPADRSRIPARVHLTGSFNGWAPAGSTGSIELASYATGDFRTLVNLPDGAHRYGYTLDTNRFVPDTNNPDTVRNGAEELMSLIVVGPRPADYPLPRPNAINTEAVRHDPSGGADLVAISRGLGLADISFHALPDDATGASVLVDVTKGDSQVERIEVACRRVRDEAGFDRFSARVMTGSPVVRYALALSDGDARWVSDEYDVSLPADHLRTPDWAKGAVWYQIFAERFRNGNPLNDPRGQHVYAMPWTADWYSISEEEYAQHRVRHGLPAGEPLEPTMGGDLFHVVWDRRFGGDLQGVVEKLDYLKDLGITAIYFNPVFEGSSMHKYDATDFRHIDDNFGTPPEAGQTPERFEWPSDPTQELDDAGRRSWSAADRYFIDVLLPEAKRRGIRIVIDGVWNHTGRDHFAFQDVMKNGNRSRFRDWFYVEFAEDGSLASWRAWDGPSGWLPKFQQTANGDLIQPVKDHLFAVTERWLDPNGDGNPSDGVDGWRLDVPLDVGLPFWVDWREHVKSINEDAIIIAEIWDDASPYLRGEHFDTQMHYPFAMPVLDWLAVKPDESRSDQLIDRLERAFSDAAQTNLIHQNLYSSHDTDRYVSMLFNPGRNYDQQNRIQDGADYRDTKPDERTYDLSILGVAIQATYLGSPMVYYGDELGMWGADDPTDRKPMAWPDVGPFENPDDGPDLTVHRAYREWLRLRQDPVIGPVLRYGDIEHLDAGSPDLFAFQRSLNGVSVRVVANRADRAQSIRRLNREGEGPARVEPRSAVYWIIDHASVREGR